MKTKLKKIAPFLFKKDEDGNYIDMMAGVFMMVCFFRELW